MKSQRDSKFSASSAFTRRGFLKAGAAASAFLIAPRAALGGRGHVSANEKLNIAGVGVGGRGFEDLRELSSENIVALADVDWSYAAHAFQAYPKARVYKDFRKLLDQEKNLDAVLVAAPDHNHAIVTMAAIRRGLHVYCEKPLTRTVHEARVVAQAAREHGVATQMGNQGMAFEGNRLINEWIWAGAIGDVREVHVWSDRPTHKGKLPLWWAQGIERPTETPSVPASLDWDLWLGPAPWRPYHPIYAPFSWRGWWDFGSGGIGDMGIHNIAPVFSALKLKAPASVTASSTAVYPESVPLACVAHFEFAARDSMPPVTLHWHDGGLLPARPEELEPGEELDHEDGILFIGDKGKMLVEGWGGRYPRLIPQKRMDEFQRPPKTLPRSIGHHKEWIAACKGGPAPRSNFDFAGPLTEAVLLGSVCVRAGGEKLEWDAENQKITNRPEVNASLHYPYRAGWEL